MSCRNIRPYARVSCSVSGAAICTSGFTAATGSSSNRSASSSRYRENSVPFTVARNPPRELNVACTAEASYPLCTMQFAHAGFPDSVPYFDHSVVSINSDKSLRVPVLQEIARFLPAKHVISRHPPRRARIRPLPHQEFQKQRRQIKLPFLLPVRQNRPEHPPRPRPPQKMFLIRRLVIRVSQARASCPPRPAPSSRQKTPAPTSDSPHQTASYSW